MGRPKRIVSLCAALYILLAVVVYFSFLKPPKPHYTKGIKFKTKGNGLSVLLITVDALRADHVSANGYPQKITPGIDGLASTGLNFTRAVTPIPRTTQSLACLLTGCYPYKTKVRALWGTLSSEVVTLTEVLRNAGYQTASLLANNVLVPGRGLDRGFELFGSRSKRWDAMEATGEALQFLDRFKGKKPFFFWIHYIDPHMPYFPPETISRELDPEYRGRYETHFGESKAGVGERAYPLDLGKERAVYRNDLDESTNQHIRRLYAAEVKFADQGIRKLLGEVARRFGDDVIIVLTADHGESLGEHDYFYEHGDYIYNAQLRVPLVFRIPPKHKLHAAGKVDDWVSLIDVFPTILGLLEIEVGSGHLRHLDGVSLIPYWEGRKPGPRPLFSESDDSFYAQSIKRRIRHDIPGRFRSVIFDGWKLIWTPFQQPGMLYELYDLESDPEELRDLYGVESARAQALEKHLQQWMSLQSAGVEQTPPTEKDLEILRSLGYVK
ncbi:MAG: sulfatase [Candidatus Aminicenantes bacterium]|nr:sulfatase [Candidatus Aminicenantes bacterium]